MLITKKYFYYIDGSSLESWSRLASVAYVLRDHLGNWISGFSDTCGISTNIKAELFPMFHGLQKAWNDGHRLIVCEFESKMTFGFSSKQQ